MDGYVAAQARVEWYMSSVVPGDEVAIINANLNSSPLSPHCNALRSIKLTSFKIPT